MANLKDFPFNGVLFGLVMTLAAIGGETSKIFVGHFSPKVFGDMISLDIQANTS